MLKTIITDIEKKKAELDRLRSLAPLGLGNLEHSHDLELTYTSNAIEGNTLSAAETMLVIEQGITIGGKPLKDHLEAIDHYDALHYIRALQQAQAGQGTEAFDLLLYQRLDATLDAYMSALREALIFEDHRGQR